ncbi:MAG TPA: TetR family transcriptional regulator [Longimicrobiales bacterium]|nr:TetR family transcriptional regulator [Longimicrobiales bacterium]
MKDAGKRSAKREETRRRLTRAAQRLFAEQGFERTTVNEIAAAAGLSRRTFFHYFEAKEDVVLSRFDDIERALLDAIRTAPPVMPILEVAERAVLAALDQLDEEEAQSIERLKRDTPALRVRDRGKYERLEHAIAGALAERVGADAVDLRTRLDAMLLTGVLRVGHEGFSGAAASGEPFQAYLRQVVATLDAGLRPAPLQEGHDATA